MTTADQSFDQIRVVRGNPGAEELAALLTVLTAVARSASSPTHLSRPRALWDRRMRPHQPPGSWRHWAHTPPHSHMS
ncbi:acyl-CoA carboxylase subunit epsilon [Streptomyces sp. NPDC021608]|uniref:acyl-CoA carboxylase subunit epsilon n=1 Tax=Streptomyces sp. NPDC021608 TaxID=3154903 RepID=UPI0033EAAB4D